MKKLIQQRRTLTACIALAALGACQTHTDKLTSVRNSAAAHDFVTAEQSIGELLGDASGDRPLFLLEKSMMRLAQGDYGAAVQILRSCRDEFKKRRDSFKAANFFKGLNDDESLTYVGYDHEHMAIQTMLLLAEMLAGGTNIQPYAAQIFDRQSELIDKPLGQDLVDPDTGRPVVAQGAEKAARSGLGAYLQGVLAESERAMSEAAKAYGRAEKYTGGARLATRSRARVESGGDLEPGTGRLHVIYLAGRGPMIASGNGTATDAALAIANVASAIGLYTGESIVGTLGQKPIPVPQLVRSDGRIPPLQIRVEGEPMVETDVIDDYYEAAEAGIEARRPWVYARALARRAVKGAAASVASSQVEQHTSNPLLSFAAGFVTNAVLTASESADTRSWSLLPAQVQAARMLLPVGEHEVDLGEGMSTMVKVGAGEDSLVTVYRPNVGIPGQVMVDEPHAVDPFIAIGPSLGAPPPRAEAAVFSAETAGGPEAERAAMANFIAAGAGGAGALAGGGAAGDSGSAVTFYVGQGDLSNDVWSRLGVDSTTVFGMGFANASPGALGLDGGFNLQTASGDDTDLLAFEAYFGGRKNFGSTPSMVPYLAAGLSATFLSLDAFSMGVSDTLTDEAFGLYLQGGIDTRLGDAASLGLSYRLLTGTSVQPSGASLELTEEADYDGSTLSLELKFAF